MAIDSGTTGAAAAVALATRSVTAMPFSVQGIAALAAGSGVTLLLPGGSVRRPEGTIVGPLAQQSLTALRFDTTILTCCAAAPGLVSRRTTLTTPPSSEPCVTPPSARS